MKVAEAPVYTHPVKQPDFLAKYIAESLPLKPSTRLNLVDWTYSPDADTTGIPETIPADTSLLTVAVDTSLEELTISPADASDILRRGGNMLSLTISDLDRWSEVDATGMWITFHENHNETILKLPSTVSLAWYIPHRMENHFQALIRDKLASALQPAGAQQAQRGGTIELLGADIAGQRVSLRVSGNVAINGGLAHKNREKSYTNFRADQNWDIDVEQKQRFDIEGTIGDRVSVLVHQDSENDFEWENNMKIAYNGEEDEILQRIDAGNISLSLPGTQFATGGSGKSSGLFGIKALSKLGPLDFTTVASIERSRKSSKSSTLAREFVISDIHFMANRYFFLDMVFRANYYPLLEDGMHGFDAGRMVIQLEVYRSVNRQEADTYSGTAYVDPNNPQVDPNYATQGNFKRLLLNEDYTFNPQLGWIRLKSPASDHEIIAVAYSLGDISGVPKEKVGDVGTAADTTDLTLKLIKARGQTITHPTWPLEFKNVYSLGGANINPEGFEVKITNRRGTTEGDDRFSNGVSYLTIFGLDKENENRDPIPDEIIDASNANLVNLARGELHFPSLLPFVYSDVPGLATSDKAIEEVYGYKLEDPNQNFQDDGDEDISPKNGKWDVPAIYYKPKNPNAKNEESRFDITVKQSSRGANEYNLGFNLVEGSETVYINRNPLVRGKDYRIDYFSGTLTIMDMSKYGADPDISIDYEENVLISFDKKVMLGTRAEMDLGESSFLGATGLYYNQSIIDDRIDVGSEPVQNMLWDINGRIAREAPLLTRLVDRLPLVETDAASRFRFEGEIAQVRPNPNPLGKAFVDDFEAAKRTTSPSLQYRAWRHASAPMGKRQGDRRKLAWWNPYTDVDVKDIWPERQTSIRARNLTTTVLVLDALFEEGYGAVTDSMWGGITYPLLASDYDQTLSKFFEVWIKGTRGRVHIDVGSISEDLNANGLIDTEDRPVAGFTEGNSLLEPEEDVGLDGCPDEFEDGMGGSLAWDINGDGTIDEDELHHADDDGDGLVDEDSIGVARLIYEGLYDGIYDGPTVPWVLNRVDPEGNPDPNGDNFYNTKATNPNHGRNNNLNGTDGNSKIQEGSYPDTEDLDGLGGIYPEDQNNYFTYSFQLDPDLPDFDPTLVGGSTVKDGKPTGWRLFRIPLTDFRLEQGMTASWDNVRHLRFWIDGLGGLQSTNGLNTRIQIAKIEFVGNEWEELGLAPVGSEEYVKVDSAVSLAVTVANTEDNADYTSPPDVEGEYDRLNDIRLREQSLMLDFRRQGIPPQHKGAIKKSVPKQTGTFLVYDSMELFVYAEGVDDLIGENSSYAKFWLRLGQGESNYYEVRKLVYSGGPDEEHRGWDSRNYLSIKMDELAKLKQDTPDTIINPSTDSIRVYYLKDENMDVYIRGEPSLERIDRYIAGVINMHPDSTLRGRVMMDELHLSDVKRKPGVAMRLSGAVNFADLLSTSFNYARKDAGFHTIQQRIARNAATSENWRVDVTFNPHRFLPQSWGVRTPLTVNYSSSTSSPKYFPGRDIPAGDIRQAPDSIQKQSSQFTAKTSFDKSTRSKNWLVRQTFDRLRGSMSYARKLESTELIKSNVSENISGQLAYPIKFSEENYIQPFKTLGFIPWLGERIKDTRLYYSPTSVDFSANLTEALNNRITRALPDSIMDTFSFNMARSIKAKYRLTDRLSADYSWNANNVLDDFRGRELEALKTLNPGKSRQFAEQFSTSYNPELISWFKPKFMYQANYNWVKNAPIDSLARGGKIAAQGRFTGSVSLQLKDIIEVFYTPESTAGAARRGRSRQRGAQTSGAQASDSRKRFEVTNPQLKVVLKLLHTVAGKVAPIAVNYGRNRRAGEPAVIDQPNYYYRLALVDTSGLESDIERTGGVNLATIGKDEDISWRSGLNLSRAVNLNFSHSRKWSETQSPSAVTTTQTKNWLFLEDHPELGIPFVNWSIRWSNLEKLPLLNIIPWKVSMDHNYSGQYTENIQNDRPVERYTRQFQPLVGFTINFNNGISTNIRASHTLTMNRNAETGRSRTTSQQITASLGYRHRGGLNIPLPLFNDIKLQNTVNLNLDFDFTKNSTEAIKGEGTDYTTQSWSKKWSITPRITYSFTDKVTGGFHIIYEEHDDYVSGKRTNRDFKFDVNIAIRGS
ncbi:MAG: cell surface protein SprA [Fidelibacterota bacterium]|nr:MAG: cell surface protein SprA [Candidatus Neomarinimicrobiota bacterium]